MEIDEETAFRLTDVWALLKEGASIRQTGRLSEISVGPVRKWW